MILYNVTVSIDRRIQQEWLIWMNTKHIPDVMATGCFNEARISRVHGEEEGGITFAITYLSPSKEKFSEYEKKHASELQQEHTKKYKGKFASFRTMLTVIQEFKP